MYTLIDCKDNLAKEYGFASFSDLDKAMDEPEHVNHELNNKEGWNGFLDQTSEAFSLCRAKDFKIWCDNQVTAGRTTHKLFLDWQEAVKK